jgi:hypothetical protein
MRTEGRPGVSILATPSRVMAPRVGKGMAQQIVTVPSDAQERTKMHLAIAGTGLGVIGLLVVILLVVLILRAL